MPLSNTHPSEFDGPPLPCISSSLRFHPSPLDAGCWMLECRSEAQILRTRRIECSTFDVFRFPLSAFRFPLSAFRFPLSASQVSSLIPHPSLPRSFLTEHGPRNRLGSVLITWHRHLVVQAGRWSGDRRVLFGYPLVIQRLQGTILSHGIPRLRRILNG
jgi:hypothetical protein